VIVPRTSSLSGSRGTDGGLLIRSGAGQRHENRPSCQLRRWPIVVLFIGYPSRGQLIRLEASGDHEIRLRDRSCFSEARNPQGDHSAEACEERASQNNPSLVIKSRQACAARRSMTVEVSALTGIAAPEEGSRPTFRRSSWSHDTPSAGLFWLGATLLLFK
jgi:hypothetical protein